MLAQNECLCLLSVVTAAASAADADIRFKKVHKITTKDHGVSTVFSADILTDFPRPIIYSMLQAGLPNSTELHPA